MTHPQPTCERCTRRGAAIVLFRAWQAVRVCGQCARVLIARGFFASETDALEATPDTIGA